MTWLQGVACLVAVSVLVAPSLAAVCPSGCDCSTTKDGLHRATCSNLHELYKFTLRQKHHNINILDLSHNNITKLSHELDRLTEVVTLDLSTNGITDIKKFLHNAKKLVHLNMANNRIQTLSLMNLPASVSSLDLTYNLLQNVPSDLGHLVGLEHLELEGNPIVCSCKNIEARDRLLLSNVVIDKVKCFAPEKFKGRMWLELKTKDICKVISHDPNLLDMMMGDQPFDAKRIGEDASALKSMTMVSGATLGDVDVIQGITPIEDDDNELFLKVNRSSSSLISDIEGSGEAESTTISEIVDLKRANDFNSNSLITDEMFPIDEIDPTEDPPEGSGEGSGFPIVDLPEESKTVTPLENLHPGPVHRLFPEDESDLTEIPPVEFPRVFPDPDWHIRTEAPEKPATPLSPPETTVSEKISSSDLPSKSADADTQTPHKTGTYVCIAIIVVLLVGLIGFAIVKGQMRKRRDRRLQRQQKRDVEKASKEMVDMNKSLLGKPAAVITPKANGKYELVPTHEPHMKKTENGDIANGVNHNNTNGGVRTESPRDTNQNKNSSKDNNILDVNPGIQDTSFESSPDSADKNDTHSLSSENIFVPLSGHDTHQLNETADSDMSQPLINGDENTDSEFLSPSREYVPVYSPDMGRVRIKLSEIPKPKTPVLVTRSRSNAGDIILTPSDGGNARKSTT